MNIITAHRMNAETMTADVKRVADFAAYVYEDMSGHLDDEHDMLMATLLSQLDALAAEAKRNEDSTVQLWEEIDRLDRKEHGGSYHGYGEFLKRLDDAADAE